MSPRPERYRTDAAAVRAHRACRTAKDAATSIRGFWDRVAGWFTGSLVKSGKMGKIPRPVLFGVRTEPRCKPREGHETETLRVPGRFVGITKATLGPGRSRDGRDNLPAGGEFDVNLLTTTRETKTPRGGDSRRSALTHGSVEFDDRRKAPRSRPCRRGLSPGGERPRIPNIHGS